MDKIEDESHDGNNMPDKVEKAPENDTQNIENSKETPLEETLPTDQDTRREEHNNQKHENEKPHDLEKGNTKEIKDGENNEEENDSKNLGGLSPPKEESLLDKDIFEDRKKTVQQDKRVLNIMRLEQEGEAGKLPIFSPWHKFEILEKPEELTLKALHEKLKEKVGSETYDWCYRDGSLAQSHISLTDYFQHNNTKKKAEEMGDTVHVYTRLAGKSTLTKAASKIVDTAPYSFLLKFILLTEDGKEQDQGSLSSTQIGDAKTSSSMKLKKFRKKIPNMLMDTRKQRFCLKDGTTVNDDLTLGEYLTLGGETVNSTGVPVIPMRFCKPGVMTEAEQQKEQALIDEIKTHIKDTITNNKNNFKAGFTERASDKLFSVDSEKLTGHARGFSSMSDHQVTSDSIPTDKIKTISAMDETHWNTVIRNCDLMYGWIVDRKANQVRKAPKAAFKLREGLNVYQSKPEKKDTTTDSTEDDAASGGKISAIPNFVVTDDSRIEVVETSNEFGKSLSENHFDATSVEVSGSGIIEGVSVGGSVGHTDDRSHGAKHNEKTFKKELVATYKFPRATISLSAEDLEPTKELKEHLKLVKEKKDIRYLRELHRTFGQLFCQQVLVGGSLKSTKVIEDSEKMDETAEKQRFKTNVGAAVGFPGVFSADVSVANEKGDDKQKGEETKDKKETIVFVATGGNTILATNPPQWSPTVIDFENWRVIERSALVPISRTISHIPKFEAVESWFLSAVPKLREYMTIPSSRAVNVRFKVNDLDKSTAISRVIGNAQTYLAHDPDHPPKAIHTAVVSVKLSSTTTKEQLEKIANELRSKGYEVDVNSLTKPKRLQVPEMSTFLGFLLKTFGVMPDMTQVTQQVPSKISYPLFTPKDVQAPVLLARSIYGIAQNSTSKKELRKTAWRMEVASGDCLTTDSTVVLKSLSLAGGKEIDGKVIDAEVSATLTVYRNGQGVFMPAFTNRTTPSFWRLERMTERTGDGAKNIKEGDDVRLCWKFSDQSAGFMDFKDDVYGRIRYTKPASVKGDTLYLKVPYPRFENFDSQAGAQLMMSTESSKEPKAETIYTLPKPDETAPSSKSDNEDTKLSVQLQDISLRLDLCDKNSLDGIDDYMFLKGSPSQPAAAQPISALAMFASAGRTSLPTAKSIISTKSGDGDTSGPTRLYGPDAFVAQMLIGSTTGGIGNILMDAFFL